MISLSLMTEESLGAEATENGSFALPYLFVCLVGLAIAHLYSIGLRVI